MSREPGEQGDTIQSLRAHRTLCAALTTVPSYDYKAEQVALSRY